MHGIVVSGKHSVCHSAEAQTAPCAPRILRTLSAGCKLQSRAERRHPVVSHARLTSAVRAHHAAMQARIQHSTFVHAEAVNHACLLQALQSALIHNPTRDPDPTPVLTLFPPKTPQWHAPRRAGRAEGPRSPGGAPGRAPGWRSSSPPCPLPYPCDAVPTCTEPHAGERDWLSDVSCHQRQHHQKHRRSGTTDDLSWSHLCQAGKFGV